MSEQRWVNLDYPESAEGWAFPMPHAKSHYFRDGRSLCGRFEVAPGFRLAGRLDEPEGDDCHVCTRKVFILAEASR